MNAIFRRVSIRKYQDKPVEQEKAVKILKAAMAASVENLLLEADEINHSAYEKTQGE